MPTSSTDFEAVPVNRNRRRDIMRAARLGTRVASTTLNVGDAVSVVDAVRAYTQGWSDSVDPFPVAVRAAWAAR